MINLRTRKRFWRGAVAGVGVAVLAITAVSVMAHPTPSATSTVQMNGLPVNGDQDDIHGFSMSNAPVLLPQGTSSVSGVIIDAVTKKPAAGIDVWINVPPTSGVTPQAATTQTNSSGVYSFTGIGNGKYYVTASKYEVMGTAPSYKNQSHLITVSGKTVNNFALKPIANPGSRKVGVGKVKNIILVDFDETFYASWYTDTALAAGTTNVRGASQHGSIASDTWAVYGWSPIDHYSLATGTYPSTRTFDTWPKPQPWGQKGAIDTNTWYATTPIYFGQQSIFDVAKGHGMSTAVIGGNDYPTGHIVDSNVNVIHLSANTAHAQWNGWAEKWIAKNSKNPNGFLLYFPVTNAEGFSVENTSPDAAGSAYQQATQLDDTEFGKFYAWLKAKGLLANTDSILTSDEAENDSTPYDNFYGMGSNGQGSTKWVPFTMLGPNIAAGNTYTKLSSIEDESKMMMYALGLPAPADNNRGKVIKSFFQVGPPPTPTPTPGPGTPTVTPTATATEVATFTPTPAPTATPTTMPGGTNIVLNGGFESGTTDWTLGGALTPTLTTTLHYQGTHSLMLGHDGAPSQNGESYAYQTLTLPKTAHTIQMTFWYAGIGNDAVAYGWQEAQLQNASGAMLVQIMKVAVDSTTPMWTSVNADLSAYAGQTVRIYFNDHENTYKTYYETMFLDAVSVRYQ